MVHQTNSVPDTLAPLEPYNNLGFLYFEKGEYGLCEENFLISIELNNNNQSLLAESTAGMAVVNMKNGNIERTRAYKETSIRLDFRMNDINYLINNLKWSDGVIGIWRGI
jgi:hypothetical protein